MGREKMNVKINTLNQTSNKTNPQNQPQQPQLQNTNIQQAIEEVIKKYIQNLQLSPQPQQSQQNNEFIVKASMKSSAVALRVENMLLNNKRVTIAGMGFAIPILVDVILLVRKDMDRLGKKVLVENLEFFEKEVSSINGKKKVISGIRVSLSI